MNFSICPLGAENKATVDCWSGVCEIKLNSCSSCAIWDFVLTQQCEQIKGPGKYRQTPETSHNIDNL